MGTSQKFTMLYRDNKDHPHACGDKSDLIYGISSTAGSSPRVWGQGSFYGGWLCLRGIIPTRVGTSCLYNTFSMRSKDHPHACGDKHLFNMFTVTHGGSSPRVWGQVVVSELGIPSCGIIPTRVGTRSAPHLLSCVHADHPHACGDKFR